MRKSLLALLILVLGIGIFLRLPARFFQEVPGTPGHFFAKFHPQPGFKYIGFDESLYRNYVITLSGTGLASYPDLTDNYIAKQEALPGAILPPTRFVYIFCAYLWHQASGTEALDALKDISSFFSIATLLLSTIFAWRLGGIRIALGASALMSFAPTQIHMGQHALIDGVLGFFALACLWLLWENLRRSDDWRWLIAYGFALALLVVTKENAAFAYLGLLAAIGLARYFEFGKPTRLLFATTVVGPLFGVAILVNLCGSLSALIQVFHLLVSKAAVLPYAIKTGDGPWYRYLVELLLVSPVIFLLATGALFTIEATDTAVIYLSAFIGGSFLVMCNVRYGMNLRYTNMWDFPIRFLAVSYLMGKVARLRYTNIWLTLAITILCLLDLRQYYLLFVDGGLYELVPEGLLRALSILK